MLKSLNSPPVTVQKKLHLVGPYTPTNFVLIEPNGNYYYGVDDGHVVHFPSFNKNVWFPISLSTREVKLPSENYIRKIVIREKGEFNQWAKLCTFSTKGVFIFKSDFIFAQADVDLLEKMRVF